MSPYLLMAIGITIGTIGQTMMKYFALKSPLTLGWDLPAQLLSNWPLLLVFGWYFVGAIIWLFILQKLPLSLAYPTLALNYVTVAAVSVLYFHETLKLGQAAAYFLIVGGVVMLYRFQ